ncbi:DUF4139 domain-containing protein [Geminicoccus roseus]|uniref:DUF4139 domain-containing protein n=1 Tax=Geminicoccus roseus TaxID=404900 RepID=UPI00040F6872|nr:DUF4139 domain-containing protein [Geminicoccus roseus]
MPARSSLRPRFASFLAGLLLASASFPVAAADLPELERVVMSTSGMGWLGFRAMTGPQGAVPLDLPASQLDDALKSLTVTAASPDARLELQQVTIGGRGVLADPFQGTPLRPDDLLSLTSLLERMRGANVEIEDDFEEEDRITGRVIGVESRLTGEDGAVVEHPYLMLSTEDGLVAIDLNEADAIQFDDPAAQDALEKVLVRSAQTRSDERRTLEILTDAAPDTEVELGLLVETPVWKPTWRLILDKDNARIQGWAVVENRTGQDWSEVQLTLTDGDARTLRQELTRAWYVERETVPVVDQGNGPLPLAEGLLARNKAQAAPQMAAMAAEFGDEFAPAPVTEAAGTEADLATTFTIKAPVDVADDGSVMVPLLDRRLDATRIAFVPAGGSGGAPDAAILLRNDTGTSLPSGIVTVLDSGDAAAPVHVGDAVMPLVPADAERRLTFGADRKITYAIEQDDSREIRSLAIANGMVTLRIAERQERRWRFESDDSQPRRIEVQAWAQPGTQTAGQTEARRQGEFWYVDGQLPAMGETSLRLITERPVEEQFVLSDAKTLGTLLASRGLEVPDAWVPKIEEISRLSARRAEAEQTLARLAEERGAIVAEQNRLRANLESVSEAGPLRERWLAGLAEQEDRLAALQDERQQATRERDQAADALRAVVAELAR